jgi:imidazolonepropionase-like amidohydrolase
MFQMTLSVLALLCCLPPALSAQSVTAIVHGQIVDGNGGPPIPDGVVLIQNDRIIGVGPAGAITVPRNARIIDATQKTILPGLADLHVHLMGGWDGEAMDMLGYQRYLDALLYAGVTTVLDLGNSLPFIQQIAQEVKAGRIPGPAVHMAGPLIDGPDPLWPPLSIAVSSDAQIPGYVRQLKRAQVDVIKGYSGLSEPALRALVEAAAAESLRVFVDMGPDNGTASVAQTGIAAFAHARKHSPITEETLRIMRAQHVATITTLAGDEAHSRRRLADLNFLRDPLLQRSMPPRFVAELTAFAARPLSREDSIEASQSLSRLRIAIANAKLLFDAGILLVAGTDAPLPGVFYGEGLHRELELLVEAGLTPVQAITTATRNAALLLNELGQWGTLEPGKRADILVVRGNPAQRIGDTRKIEFVIQAGRVLNRKLSEVSAKSPDFRTSSSVMAP